MQPFDLRIEDTVGIDCHPLLVADMCTPFPFLFLFNGLQMCNDIRILCIGMQLCKALILPGIHMQQLHQIRIQLCIAGMQPAGKGDTIGFIFKFFRIQLIKGMQLALLQYLCVQSRNPVDAFSKMYIHMCHMHAIVRIDQCHTSCTAALICCGIQCLQNAAQMRNYGFQIGHRPGFQSLCQNRMIGVCTRFFNNAHRLLHTNSLLHQLIYQLRYDQRWMGIIDLNHGMLIQSVQIMP